MRQPPSAYVVPSALRDLVLLDMVALIGTTSGAGEHLHLSQPTVSRRCRRLAAELGLGSQQGRAAGERTADSICLRLLRKGVNRHRWDAGVLRLGGRRTELQQLDSLVGIEWVTLDRVPVQRWGTLLRRELLDGVVVGDGDGRDQAWRGCHRHGFPIGGNLMVVQARRHPTIRRLLEARLAAFRAAQMAA